MILWTGVVVGLVGLAATASNGVALMLRRLRQWAAAARRWIDHQLARVFPSRRRDVTVVPLTASAHAVAHVTGSAFGTMKAPPGAPVDQRLDVLERAIDLVNTRITQVEQDARSRHSELSGKHDALTTEVRESITTLARRLDDESTDAARTDARGLWPVAFGFVLVAVPSQLAHFSGVGAAVTAAALIVTAAVGQMIFPDVLRRSAP